jgi:hypothetical protein
MMKDSNNNKAIRKNMAMNKPMRLAISCLAFGNLLTNMEIKMMLSMPSTSSSKVKVASAIHIWGLVNKSMLLLSRGKKERM